MSTRRLQCGVVTLIVTGVFAVILLNGFTIRFYQATSFFIYDTSTAPSETMEFYDPDELNSSKENIPTSSSAQNSSLPKSILVWTTFFGQKFADFNYSHYNCSFKNCIATYNRSKLSEVDAVLFHFFDVDTDDLPLFKPSGQKWVMFTLETNNALSVGDYKSIGAKIDYLATYRRDSQVWSPYGQVIRREKDINYVPKIEFGNRKKDVIWFVSHCTTMSKREELTGALKKFSKVDIYGRCGTLECSPSEGTKCLEMAEKTYKFYLAFENALCKDYVTEKLFNALKYDIIPVVYGGAEYEKILPEMSYIDARNFRTVEALADYLKVVANNETLYNSYFNWKRFYKVVAVPMECSLCEALHKNVLGLEARDIGQTMVNEAECRTVDDLVKAGELDIFRNFRHEEKTSKFSSL